jgi:putative SOS response-associated peptidase YedK
MARPGRPERNRAARSFRQHRRFHHVINSNKVFGTHKGETTNDLYAFLTTEPNAEVSAIHPKAMPVILTTPDKVEAWMTAPPDEALKLQRPLPDRALRIVARGVKEDAAEAAWAAFEGKTKRFDSLF